MSVQIKKVLTLVLFCTVGMGATLTGIIFDVESNNPIAGASISLYSRDGGNTGDSTFTNWYEAVSNENGEYQIVDVVDGEYDLSVYATDYEYYNDGEFSIDGDLNLDIGLSVMQGQVYYTVSGTVTDANNGQGIQNAFIDPYAYKDENGFYSFDFAGTINLEASAYGYESSVITIEVVEDMVVDFNLEPMELNGSLFGFITNIESGQSVADITVYLFEADSSGMGHNGPWTGYEIIATSDENGFYSFDNLYDGDYIVWIEPELFNPFDDDIMVGGSTEYDIVLTPVGGIGTISGFVSFEDGEDDVFGTVGAFEVNGWNWGEALVNEDGSYSMSVPEGDYYVYCMVGAGERDSLNWLPWDSTYFYMEYYDNAQDIEDATSVFVSEGSETSDINFGVESQGDGFISAFVTGVITNAAGSPIAYAEVSLYEQGNSEGVPTITNSEGVYTFNELTIDQEYSLFANGSGYENNSQTFDQEGLVTIIDIEMVDVLSVDIVGLAKEVKLGKNYPNPFNPVTSISFTIPGKQIVQLTIFDILGNEISTLLNSELSAGLHNVQWNGSNMIGQQVASGVYLYTLKTNGKSFTQKMLFTK